MADAATILALGALGLSLEQVAGVVEILDREAQSRKAKSRERMRAVRERARTNTNVREHDNTVRAQSELVSPKEIPPAPPKEITLSASLRSDTTKDGRASRIPENFVPDVQAAYDAGLSEAETLIEVANFLDYWRSKSTNATKRDWNATWRIWCRKAASDRGRQFGRGPPARRASPLLTAYAELMSELDDPENLNGHAKLLDKPTGNRDRTGEDVRAVPANGSEPGRPKTAAGRLS